MLIRGPSTQSPALGFVRGGITCLPRKRMWLSVLFSSALSCGAMSITPRAERWLKMAEDARSMAERTRDQDGKRTMLEIANGYDELAAWAAKTDQVGADELD